MFQRIVVPLDGSARAEQAVPVAARLARGSCSQVLLLEVVNTPTDYSGGVAPVGPIVLEEQIESEIPVAQEYLSGSPGGRSSDHPSVAPLRHERHRSREKQVEKQMDDIKMDEGAASEPWPELPYDAL